MNELIQGENISANQMISNADNLNSYVSFANLMADAKVMLPAHLVGRPADCLAVALQAAAWGMSPFAVAQKTHLVNGTLGYEAQLVNAVITSSNRVKGRFHYKIIGEWENWKYKNVGTNGKVKHGGENEKGLAVQVGAVLAGETEITWDDPLYIEHIVIRNSPLWQSRPIQQMKYLAVKYWARLYCPEVILGVYSPDELTSEQEAVTEREINPIQSGSKAGGVDLDDIYAEEKPNKKKTEPAIDVDDVFAVENEGEQATSKNDAKFTYLLTLLREAETANECADIEGIIFGAKQSGELSQSEIGMLKIEAQKARNRIKAK